MYEDRTQNYPLKFTTNVTVSSLTHHVEPCADYSMAINTPKGDSTRLSDCIDDVANWMR